MNRDSVTKLRLDRRLLYRRGWISPEEREAALADLPDVSAKATTLGEIGDGSPAGGSASPEPSSPVEPSPDGEPASA